MRTGRLVRDALQRLDPQWLEDVTVLAVLFRLILLLRRPRSCKQRTIALEEEGGPVKKGFERTTNVISLRRIIATVMIRGRGVCSGSFKRYCG
jgi:hypothetical protein